MKKIYALIGIAATFAAACAREDIVQDSPELASGKTVITLTLDEAKTTVGDLSGGKRPVYWADGDKVAVNGVVSDPLENIPAGSRSASFSFSSVVNPPFLVVYPETSWKDDLSVNLPQQAKSGILPLVGYGDAQSISVKAITAAVKLSIKLSSEADPDTDKIAAVWIISDDAQLSGVFAVDFETGELTPYLNPVEEDRKVSIFPNLTLSDTAKELFIPVPAGTYSFKVKIVDRQGHLMEIPTSSPKTFVAGEIKAFPEIEFKPTGTELGIEIASAQDLIDFATAYNNKEYLALGGNLIATVTADIDFDDTSSAAFNATGGIGTPYGGDNYFHGVFNGNNKTISGLEATVPLFGGTGDNGIVKDLTLDDTCTYTFTHTDGAEGMFASVVGYHKGVLDNVKVAADINVAAVADITKMTTVGGLTGRTTTGVLQNGCEYSGLISTPAGFTTTGKLIIGGLVGRFSNAGSVTDCTFKGAISNAAQVTSEDKSNPYLIIGGVVGHMDGGASVTSCSSTADHTAVESAYSGATGILVNKTTVAYNSAVGGIVGEVVKGTVSSCNNGATIMNTIIRALDAENTNARYMETGGIVGRNGANGIVDDCNNNATVYHRSNPRIQRIGGIVGQNVAGGTVSNCANNADVAHMTTSAEGDAKLYGGRVISLGGIIGDNASSNISNVSNAATLTVSRTEAKQKNAVDVALGGIIGNNTASIDGGASKNISNTGKVYYNTNMSVVPIGYSLGGIVGKTSSSVQNVVNSGYVQANWTANAAQNFYIGGIVGQILEGENNSSPETIIISGCDNTPSEAANSGEVNLGITIKDLAHKNCIAGGIVGYVNNCKVSITNCNNSGYVHAAPSNVTVTDSGIYVGGVVGYLSGASSLSNCNNTGYTNINAGNNTDDDITKIFADGGIVGVVKGTATGRVTITDCDWTYSTKAVGSRRGTCAGIAAYAEYADISDCEVTVDYNMYNHVTGGIVGWSVNSTMTNCKYHGTKIASTQGYWAAGIVAKLTAASVVDGCYNYCADITATKAQTVIGEIAAVSEAGTTIKNCHHTGTINICSDTNFTNGGGNAADLL